MEDAMIKKLEEKGFKRWEKAGYDRLYINLSVLGLDYGKYKTGNISWATFKGKEISNSQCRRYLATKVYIDLLQGDRVHAEYVALAEAVQELLKEARKELENVDVQNVD